MAEERKNRKTRAVRACLVQFDAIPEQVERNADQIELFCRKAAASEARWVIFHEATVSDCTAKAEELAEAVPEGRVTRRMAGLAEQLGCYISFGLCEKQNRRLYITQVFVGPNSFFYRYRKTWLWYSPEDIGYRNEWARYDPGTGPELFEIGGSRATCFICADGEAPRCIARAAALSPEVGFYPNNRKKLPPIEVFGERAKAIRATIMLVTNRVGKSWMHDTQGGCAVFGADGIPLAMANHDGKEEMIFYDLDL